MGTVIFISLICIVNLLLWIVFLTRFKKLFSTQDIRNELNRMIADINRNTAQDLSLMDAKIAELKQVLEIADKKITTVKKEAEQKKAVEELKSEIIRAQSKKTSLPLTPQTAYAAKIPVYTPNVTYAETPVKPKKDLATTIKEYYDSGVSVEEIASRTGKTTTEVMMVIDMNL